MEAHEALARSRNRGPASKKTLDRMARLAERDTDGYPRCVYCGAYSSFLELILEHVVPRSIGGPDGDHNRVLACPRCDRVKGGRTPQQAFGSHSLFLSKIANRPTEIRRGMSRDGGSSVHPASRTAARFDRRPLARRAFVDIGFCCTCQRPIDRTKPHPKHHLLLPNYDPELDDGKSVL